MAQQERFRKVATYIRPEDSSSILEDEELFGHLAAEEEKELLSSFFQETDSFKRIHTGNKYIVLGRKGSGKSAIFLYLARKVTDEGNNIANISLDEYPSQVFAKLRDTEIEATEAHVKTWRFVLLVTLMDLYTKYVERQQIKNDPHVKAYNRFLKQHFDYRIEDNIWQRIFSFLKNFSSMNVTALGISAGLHFDPSNITKEEFGQTIHLVNTKLEELLKQSLAAAANNGVRFFVCLDRLDEQWRNNKETNSLLVGLFKAVRNLNLALPNTKLIIFLRSDIYEHLKYQNKAHTSEYIERLTWTEKLLELMIARRISARLKTQPSDQQWFIDEMWSAVFDDITQMYGGGRKQMLRNFIHTRSFNRPRDYISMMKALQEVAQRHSLKKISAEVMRGDQILNVSVEAERTYSERAYQEFQDEVQDQIASFDQIMDAIRNGIGYFSFSFEDFNSALQQANIISDSRTVLSQLFEFSVVGFNNPGGRETSTGRVGARGDEYRYQSDTLQFEIRKSGYKIHPSLRRHLNLSERRNRKRNRSLKPLFPAQVPSARKHTKTPSRSYLDTPLPWDMPGDQQK